MKVYVEKEEWKHFVELSNEGRTRYLLISPYPQFTKESDREIELELK